MNTSTPDGVTYPKLAFPWWEHATESRKMTHRAHEQDEGAVRVRKKDSLGQVKRDRARSKAVAIERGERSGARSKGNCAE